jgi:hypothetical protein
MNFVAVQVKAWPQKGRQAENFVEKYREECSYGSIKAKFCLVSRHNLILSKAS